MQIKKERNINLDLIRCFALIMVPTMHGFDNTGLYTIPLTTVTDVLVSVFRILVTTCIPLYLMLVGYLNHKKTLSRRYYLGYVRIYLTYILCTIPCMFLEYCYKHRYDNLLSLINSVLNFECNGYAWYLLMYSGLFIMLPFLNMMYHGCSSQRQKLVLIGTFFALSILPSLLNFKFHIYPLWWKNLYPICYYFTGAYLSEYMPEISAKKAGLFLLGFLGLYSVFVFACYGLNGSALLEVYQTNWGVYVLGVLVFVFGYRLSLENIPQLLRRLIIWVSDMTLIIYMLTWICDGLSYPIMVRIAPAVQDRYIWLLVTVPFALIGAGLMALVVDRIYKPLYKWIMGWLPGLLKL